MEASTVLKDPDESLVNTAIDLSNCDREPIHIPGSIQPFGFLLCLKEETLQIVVASENAHTYTGLPLNQLLGNTLDVLLGAIQLAQIRRALTGLTEGSKWLPVQLDQAVHQPHLMAVLHRHDGLLWLEFEPLPAQPEAAVPLSDLNGVVRKLLKAPAVGECCQQLVESIRTITGFDRVVVYRFKEDESGQVVAEAKREDLETWVDLHYPASDIPRQARMLYAKNWLRFIPDADYTPVKLAAAPGFPRERPPDMTYSILRSVSPIHIEYMQNMGVQASMSISIIRDEQLWGLVACHHHTPRLLANDQRNLCEFIGCTFSALLKEKEHQQEQTYWLRIRNAQARLLDQLKGREDFREALQQSTSILMEMVDCGGVAICFEEAIITAGAVPPPDGIRTITEWLYKQGPQEVFCTQTYPQLNPAAGALTDTCSGLLAVSLSRVQGDYLLWFRPEVIQTVTWAGEPRKAVIINEGEVRLSPRKSFAAWKELVRGTSLPWQPMEVEAGRQVRSLLIDILLKVSGELKLRADRLARLNLELEKSNQELDSFAYVASHDLKEPLRGIHNYSVFLLEDYAGKLDAEGEEKLQTLVRLSKRMEALIESLLQFSRVGRVDLAIASTDLNQTLAEVLDMLGPRLKQVGAKVTLLNQLPTLECDRVRVAEVFNNLITNAVRYNDNAHKNVEIGVLTGSEARIRGKNLRRDQSCYVFFVRDNGIGIDEKHHENIFKIFKRLHTQEKYGGGTGAGLTIAKKIVEKHEGDIWVESAKGQGTTFYFTLQPPA